MKTDQAVVDGLQNLLADTYLLYIKTQGFHWNVTGPNFGPLHQMFQTQYEELRDANDLIAERIRAVGGFAAGSCAEFTQNSNRVSEVDQIRGGERMIRGLHEDHAAIANECRIFVGKLGLRDTITEQLVADRALAHEKMAWILKSHLE